MQAKKIGWRYAGLRATRVFAFPTECEELRVERNQERKEYSPAPEFLVVNSRA